MVLLRPVGLGPHIEFSPEISHAVRDAEDLRSVGNKILHSLTGEEMKNAKEIPAGVGIAEYF